MTDDLAQLYSIQPVCSALTTLFRQCCHRFSNQMCGIILNYAIVNVGNLCISSPLEVFKVTTYLGLVPGFTVSNSVFVLFAIIGACGVLTLFSLSLETIVPTAGQAMIEMMHSTVSELFRCTENGTNAFSNRVYVPLFLTFFLFISAINLSGMIPYSMTATSHVALTLGTSLALFMSVTITGLIKHQERFFDMFLPPNLPLALVPFMIALEIIGFLARSLSLGVRLTANMLAGHTLLKLICMLLGGLYLKGGVFVGLPGIILFALCGLEFGVAFIQSYVFTLIASSSIMKSASSQIHLGWRNKGVVEPCPV